MSAFDKAIKTIQEEMGKEILRMILKEMRNDFEYKFGKVHKIPINRSNERAQRNQERNPKSYSRRPINIGIEVWETSD